MKLVVGYGKLSRAWSLTNSGTVGAGDTEVQRALMNLATRHPDVEWRMVTRNSGEDPQSLGYPENVTNPWRTGGNIMTGIRTREKGRKTPLPPDQIESMCSDLTDIARPSFMGVDALVLWVGHHGTSNSPLPPLRAAQGERTRPYDNFILYGSYLLRMINEWRDIDPVAREEIWLCADPRNYIKARDLKWPLRHPVLCQNSMTRGTTHYRYGDPIHPKFTAFSDVVTGHDDINWTADVRYDYAGIELAAAPPPESLEPNFDHENRYDFGILLSENKKDVKDNRLKALQQWVLPFWPDCEIFGKWTDVSKEELGRPDIRECPHKYLMPTLQRWRCTLTTPASGTGWATAKPWEAFAAGTVCFFHPKYDTQNHILKGAPQELFDWLRVESPEQLFRRVKRLSELHGAWKWLVQAQREHFENRYAESHGGVIDIERRLGLLT